MTSGGPHRKRCRRWNIPWDAHELTFSCFHRQAFLATDRTRRWFALALDAARVKHAFDVWAYVIMPEHVHLVICPRQEAYDISAILKSVKQPVGRRAVNWLKRHAPRGLARLATGPEGVPYRFRQAGGGYDRNVRRPETLRGMIDYIHANPVRRGLVDSPEQWPWSSWRAWEYGLDAPISIDRETFPIVET